MSSFLLRRSAAASAGAAARRAFSTSSPRSVARITIIGNLADTPEAQTSSSSDKEYVRYSVASNSGSKENRQTSWFRVTSFVDGPRKDFMLSLPKGTLVYVEGDASISSYTDSTNQVRHGLNIVQRSIEVLKRPSLPEQGE
ncbi:hypothetical protein CCMA1212_002033 [Trichoderma ghanense]|uniref:SsDNA binding protein n=1 Tax=Trichoderma ghanense TaxID=65468 RepID=A0ABY2HCM4_9HYPO